MTKTGRRAFLLVATLANMITTIIIIVVVFLGLTPSSWPRPQERWPRDHHRLLPRGRDPLGLHLQQGAQGPAQAPRPRGALRAAQVGGTDGRIRGQARPLGVRVPEVFLPAAGTDYSKWAVVACDQYSSEREYWRRAEGFVGGAPSTLGLIFPEAYLEDADADGRIARIQATMRAYLERGVLASAGEGLVLVERFTPSERSRAWASSSPSTSRPTATRRLDAHSSRPSEGTIVERLPPRMRIRRGAALELPHIMLLLDDPRRSVIEPIYARRERPAQALRLRAHARLGPGPGLEGRRSGAPRAAGRRPRGASPTPPPSGPDTAHSPGERAHRCSSPWATATTPSRPPRPSGRRSRPPIAARRASWTIPPATRSPSSSTSTTRACPSTPSTASSPGIDEASLVEPWRATRNSTSTAAPRPRQAAARLVDRSGRESGSRPTRSASPAYRAAGSLVITFPRPKAKLAAGTVQDFLDPLLKSGTGIGIDYIHGTESLLALAARPGQPRPLPSAYRQVGLLRHRDPRRRHAPKDLLDGGGAGKALLYRSAEDHEVVEKVFLGSRRAFSMGVSRVARSDHVQ